MQTTEISVSSPQELDEVAKVILEHAGNERIFIFRGSMGAGKTTLIKSLASALGVKETVSSPTFSIVNEYHAGDTIVYHFDFYRIRDLREAYDIGYEEYFYSGHYCFIEWPEKVEPLLPENYLTVSIKATGVTERLLLLSKSV
ncbi:tRNA (adenosine(37)-N6)-threonylcarbamoyltransferase complex ATPase subunit type 1 TsaE [Pedobacter sp. JY14-1]|uniref:tRNA (adenosine(37)-N6)-threonylcarbamoyltransferase complex ATPase subunit type 1 TsaE n=1 Tax=Pedobacter sp. JY14-1 TaxID=3034151 RepID=UPI0023E1B769|nr:tRNA (adenosine(37)-N6)-threonylcarbamoyltransferase complex ATPase subunit type 1 TsaE [Pedobacter sp. JY14-1]